MTHSFEPFITKARPQLLGYAKTLTRIDPEDLVQETFARAVTTGWCDGSFLQFMKWARNTVRCVLIDRVRYNDTRKDGLPTLQASYPTETSSHVTEASVESRDLRRGLDALVEDHRTVILAIGIEGLSYKEAAELLQWPIGTVMSRLSRAREALHRHLEEGVPAARNPPALRLVQNDTGLRHPAVTARREADIPPRLTFGGLRAA